MVKIAGVAILMLVIALGITGKLLTRAYEDIGVLKANVAVAEAATEEQRQALLLVEIQFREERQRVTTLQEEHNATLIERDTAVQDLNNFRSKISRAAEGRPVRVGRLATRATARVMQQFFTASGGTPDEPGGAVPTAPPGSDPAR